jgi:scyllo-inositol 2-dehydrogenase (NADP+)
MIRVGLVGYGVAGKVFHAPMITAVEGLELAAVVERHSRNAEQLYPNITTYTSLEAMLEDPSLEVIVIATPNQEHVPLAHKVLDAGRHVVVDKPVGVNSEEIAELIEHGKRVGKLVIPYHNRRWDNGFRTLKQLLREQRIGDVVYFEATFDRWRPQPRGSAWRESKVPGSGILLDLGTHLVDEALQLFGLPLSVSAEVLCERPWAVANDSFTIRLRYPRLIATLSANCLSTNSRPHYTVRGTGGGYIKWGLDPQEARLKETFRVEEPGWGVEPAENWGTLTVDVDGNIASEAIEPIPGDYRLYYVGVRDAVLGKAAQPVEAIDSWRATRVLELAEESSQERREIECDWASAN